MSAHTPGPWVIITDSGGEPQHIKSEKYTTVCSFLTSVKRNCGTEEIACNSRLIVAAPDLLEACNEALDYLESWKDLGGSKAYQMVSAAIAKATDSK